MFEHEITIQVNESLKDLKMKLEKDGFKLVRQYYLIDTYLIPKSLDVDNIHTLDILDHAVIIRNINDEKIRITFKEKEYNDKFEIVKQEKLELKVTSEKDSILFFEKIGYKQILKIYNDSFVYVDERLEFTVQSIKDDAIYIEMENKFRHSNKVYENIEDMIDDLSKLNINFNKDNYFVKKVEKLYNRKYKDSK